MPAVQPVGGVSAIKKMAGSISRVAGHHLGDPSQSANYPLY